MIIYNDKHEKTRQLIRAVIYIRFSSKMQAQSFSIEYQLEECLRYLESKGYKFIKSYIDKAKTGKKTVGREALEEMLFDAGRNKFDRIIVFSFSRSFRNTRDALNTNHDLMEKHGITIESVIEPIDMTSPHGKFSGTNLFAMHELQSDIIAAHVRSGMYVAAKQGYYLGGPIPFGYSLYETGEFTRGKPRKKFCINEEEAAVVKWMFDMLINGFSIGYIQQELIRREIKSRTGGHFSPKTIYNMFRYPFYIGTREYEIKGYDKIFMENSVPAIIDIDTWNAAQEKNRLNSQHVKPRHLQEKRLYALTGKIECACCGSHYIGLYKKENRVEKKAEGYAYYMCREKKFYRTCKSRMIRKDHLEGYCIAQIKKHILTPEKIKEIAAFIVSQVDETPDLLQEELNNANARKRELMEIIKKLQRKNVEANEVMKEVNDELIAEYSHEVQKLNEKIARLDSIESSSISEEKVVQFLNDCALNIDSPDPHVVKSVFDKLISKIIIHDDKVELYLIVFPFVRAVPTESQGCPCYQLSTDIDRALIKEYEPK